MVSIKVGITIRDNSTGKYYRIPVLPEEIAYGHGDAIKDTVKIIDLGNVDFHSGRDLDVFAWSSFFPARYDAGYCMTPDLKKPLEYQKLFTGWKNAGTSLQLICPAADINAAMTLNSFKPSLQGFEGDIYYQLSFTEKRVIKPVQLSLASVVPQKPKAGPANRDPVPSKTKPGTYTVKSGDTLTRIAKANGITPWKTLYEKNKTVIGSNPNAIDIGQVLTL